MCEKLVGVISAIGELKHTKFLKPSFFYALKWAIKPVLSDQVTYTVYVFLKSVEQNMD